jgi:hypothetical protein
MARRVITALYDSYDEAVAAVRKLESMGVPHGDISIVANNEGDRYTSATEGRTYGSKDADEAETGAGTGATLGTLIGGGAGLLAGLGLLAIPGLGPVVAAGWLISTLTGAGIGAAAGGLAGSLVGAGVPEEHAQAYAEGVRRGGALITVRAEEGMVDRIVDVLDDHGSVDMDQREQAWRQEGWTGSAAGSSATTSYVGTGAVDTPASGAGPMSASADRSRSASATGALGATATGAAEAAGDAVSNAAADLTGSDDRARGSSAATTDADRTRGAGATGTATDKGAIPIV